MTRYESEIQELVYGLITEDATLIEYLGGDTSDYRVYLSLNEDAAPVLSEQRPGYIVIETMPGPAPVLLGSGIDDWTQRYCLHVFTRPEDRRLRRDIETRFRKVFHRKNFVTERFIVYHVCEDGREGTISESGLFDYRYTISLKFLERSAG